MSHYLTSHTLHLRAMEPEDLDFLYTVENDTRLWEHASTQVPYSRYQLSRYIESNQANIYLDNQLRLIITLRASGEAIGAVDLFDFDPHHQRAAVGIVITTSHQHCGWGKEALLLLQTYAFECLQLQQLYAHVEEENIPSIRLFTGGGFTPVGILRNWVRRDDGFHHVTLFQLVRE